MKRSLDEEIHRTERLIAHLAESKVAEDQSLLKAARRYRVDLIHGIVLPTSSLQNGIVWIMVLSIRLHRWAARKGP